MKKSGKTKKQRPHRGAKRCKLSAEEGQALAKAMRHRAEKKRKANAAQTAA